MNELHNPACCECCLLDVLKSQHPSLLLLKAFPLGDTSVAVFFSFFFFFSSLEWVRRYLIGFKWHSITHWSLDNTSEGKQSRKYALNFSTGSWRKGLPKGSQVAVIIFSWDDLGLGSGNGSYGI